MKILLVRHAESLGNLRGEIQGQQESPLSETGQQQAQQLAQYLQHQIWSPTHIYTSPLQRARQTAEILALGRPLLLESTLMEIHNGILEGLTWTEAQLQYPQLCEQLLASSDPLRIPGAESLQAVAKRSRQFWDKLGARHSDDDRLWIISHGGLLQYLIQVLLGCSAVWGLTILPTALFEFDCPAAARGSRHPYNPTTQVIRRFNERPHLLLSAALP
ncbi:histidine phosphatase family protein [Lyngbya confervoides]|uniref:Histidine phosphatase family protein n=1 Tax=Lyngbya confervoides BDU141951 TaxID=1574623 RepID=A0ABD4SZ83_9CYAN|nr:histidine phosphatase family protein [Lyngbya confervoides]MCM1981372.1 histidine phosphatase family protein [Lyngbya confervoides BDU141951]